MADKQLTAFLIKILMSDTLLDDFKDSKLRADMVKNSAIDFTEKKGFVDREPVAMADALRNNQGGGKGYVTAADKLARDAAQRASESAKASKASASKAASSAAAAKKAADKASGRGR